MRASRWTFAAVAILFIGTLPVSAQRGGGRGGDDDDHGRPEKGRGQHAPQEHGQRAQPQHEQPPRQEHPQPQQHAQQGRAGQERSRPQEQRPQAPQRAQPDVRDRNLNARVNPPRVNSPQAQQGPQPQNQGNHFGHAQRTDSQVRAWQQQRGWQKSGAWTGRATWQQARARNWAQEHRSWAQRGGYGGYYVPDDRFRLYFGAQHPFRIRTRPVIYMGYPRFVYGGYSFLIVDPYPEYWADDWYYADDVYVDYDPYDEGYYLYDRRQPNVRLAITITL